MTAAGIWIIDSLLCGAVFFARPKARHSPPPAGRTAEDSGDNRLRPKGDDMRISRFFAAFCAGVILFSLASSPVLAKSQQGGGKAVSQAANNLSRGGVSLTEARRIAADEGLTGRNSLPPGIAKNLERGKPLPPGIAKNALPQKMSSRLPYHSGYEWLIAGYDLILVQKSTSLVADVLSGVFK